MPRSAVITRKGVTKSADLIAAERAGQDMLYGYCRAKAGRQMELCRATDLLPAVVSRMSNYLTPISFEAAVLFDVATKGELPAEALCPSRADLIARFFLTRAVKLAA